MKRNNPKHYFFKKKTPRTAVIASLEFFDYFQTISVTDGACDTGGDEKRHWWLCFLMNYNFREFSCLEIFVNHTVLFFITGFCLGSKPINFYFELFIKWQALILCFYEWNILWLSRQTQIIIKLSHISIQGKLLRTIQSMYYKVNWFKRWFNCNKISLMQGEDSSPFFINCM